MYNYLYIFICIFIMQAEIFFICSCILKFPIYKHIKDCIDLRSILYTSYLCTSYICIYIFMYPGYRAVRFFKFLEIINWNN